MTRNDYALALRKLARDQDRVTTIGQLAGIGVPQSFVRERCKPGGRWQRPLPRVVVLHSEPLTENQRRRAALAFAGHPADEVMITGAAALALHGIEAAPLPSGVPVVDVLVASMRRIRTHTWVRVHHTRRLPATGWVDALPVAPMARAAADGVSVSCDPEWAGDVIRELVGERGIRPGELAEALGAEVLGRRPGVARFLGEAGLRPPAHGLLRTMVARAGLRPPLWRPTLKLDGVFLAAPDAFWPRDGVVLDLSRGAGGSRMEALGLRVLHVAPGALTRQPGQVVAALRGALTAGPYGPLERITALPGG
ncbi:hypothetical protein [Actinacidiphila oryziradicis]|uniref:hypothetical protein n=1 Tax=Actinacidiphila oryziradicis TaxID=2571141 RepID=UPI0023F335FC|nr:hypothetical protein [Actinacidiphila oryziradicis]MCW2871355.1 hypothetical protein [Actinacidiphila oryziradicis]